VLRVFMLIGLTAALAACGSAATAPLSISSPALDSGITSSGGGGTQSLGNNRVGGGVTTTAAPAR